MFLPVTKCVWSFVNIEQLFELTLTLRISIQTQMIDLPKYLFTLNEGNKQNMCVWKEWTPHLDQKSEMKCSAIITVFQLHTSRKF